MKVAFAADSTIGLDPERARALGFEVIPAKVIVDGVVHRDYLDITPQAVVAAFRAQKSLSTSQPNPEEFARFYEHLLSRHDRVVSAHASSKLSGIYASARQASAAFSGRVKVIDTLSLNAGLRLVLEEARRRLEAGLAWEDLEAALSAYAKRIRGLVLPATLEALLRSGRISGLAGFVGQLLRILPVLAVEKGEVFPIDRVRGFKQGLRRIAELLRRQKSASVVLAHAENPEATAELAAMLGPLGIVVDPTIHDAGAAVTAQAGPGAIGVFIRPGPEP